MSLPDFDLNQKDAMAMEKFDRFMEEAEEHVKAARRHLRAGRLGVSLEAIYGAQEFTDKAVATASDLYESLRSR